MPRKLRRMSRSRRDDAMADTQRSFPPPPPRQGSYIRPTRREEVPATERVPETSRSPRAHSVAVRPTHAGFQREVARVLVGYYGARPEAAVRLVGRWSGYIQKQWTKGAAATKVADRISGWQRDGEPCPCK